MILLIIIMIFYNNNIINNNIINCFLLSLLNYAKYYKRPFVNLAEYFIFGGIFNARSSSSAHI